MRNTATESRLTIDRLCDEGCVNVLKAFVKLLSTEYKDAYSMMLRMPSDKKTKELLEETRSLIVSPYFEALTNLEGLPIVEQLEAHCIEMYG